MSNTVTLRHGDVNSGFPVIINTFPIKVSCKNNLNRKPTPGVLDSAPKTSFTSQEAATYNISFVISIDASGNELTTELLYDLFQAPITEDRPLTLSFTYGSTSVGMHSLQKVSGSRVSSIPVIISDISLSFDPGDVKDINQIYGSMTLVETK